MTEEKLTKHQLIKSIINCDLAINKKLNINNLDFYPKIILDLGETYIKKAKLIEKLIKYEET